MYNGDYVHYMRTADTVGFSYAFTDFKFLHFFQYQTRDAGKTAGITANTNQSSGRGKSYAFCQPE